MQVTPDDFRQWRSRINWTQRQAAALFAVPKKTYEGWEQGYRAVHNPGPILRLMALVHFEHEALEIMKRTDAALASP